MAKKIEVKGNIPALVTPFNSKEEVDEIALRQLVDHLIEKKVHAIFASGTAGAFYLMSPEERKKVGEIVVDQANGRVPVYLGTGGIFAKETIQVAKHAKDIGADAAVILTPYYIKITDAELFTNFRTIIEAVDTPMILYNNPSRANINITPEVLEKLVSETDNVVGIKDSSGDLIQMQDYIKRVGDKISIIVGRDELIFAALSIGAKGTVNVIGNIVPYLITDLYEEFQRGNIEKARELQYRLLILRKAMGVATYPAPVMAALNLIGKPGGQPRKPVLSVKAEQMLIIKDALKTLGLLKS